MSGLHLTPPLWGLIFAICTAILLWLISLRIRNSAIADLLWGFGAAGVVDIAAWLAPAAGVRAATALLLVNVWAVRLCAYLLVRHRGGRARNVADGILDSGWRSLMHAFLLQAILIWFVAAPPVAAMLTYTTPMGLLDYAGIVMAACAILIEALADFQLARFRAIPSNANKVLDRGLWGFTRHPNYFGEALLWWGLFLIGFSASGAWWLIVSPVLVTVLLLQAPMEETITQRRPAYDDYRRRVSAFVPMLPFRRRRS